MCFPMPHKNGNNVTSSTSAINKIKNERKQIFFQEL